MEWREEKGERENRMVRSGKRVKWGCTWKALAGGRGLSCRLALLCHIDLGSVLIFSDSQVIFLRRPDL
jgi:hypothetical protein